LAIKPTLRPASVARMHEFLAPLVLCFAACGLACSHLPPPRARPPAATQAPSPPPPLPPAVDPAAQRELRLTLPAGTYVRLAILSAPMDLAVREVGPEGQPLEEVELASGSAEPTRLSWVTAVAGEYRWTVEPSGPQALAGSYAIALDEERQAGPCDAARGRVERAVVGAQWEMSRPGDQAPEGRRARALVEPVLPDATEAGEREGVLAVLVEMARSARRQGSADAASLLNRSLDLARGIDDRLAEARALEEQVQLGSAASALDSLRAVIEKRRQFDDEAGQAAALYLMGYYYHLQGDFAHALESYRRCLDLQWRSQDRGGLPWTLCEIGLSHGKLGDADRARDYLDLCFELGQEVGNAKAQAYSLGAGARLDIDVGELQAAYRQYTDLRKLLPTLSSGVLPAQALDGLATVLLYLGEPERARQAFVEAFREFEVLDDPAGRAHALLGIGWSLEAEGSAPRALEYFEQALEISRAKGLRSYEAWALYTLGRAHRKRGQPLQAIPQLETALSLQIADSAVSQAQTEVELGNSYGLVARMDAARSAFQRAIRLSGRAPLVEASALAGLARIERDGGDLGAARSAINRALAITEKIRLGVIRPDQRVSFLASRRAYYEFYVDLLMRFDRLRPGAGFDTEAVAASEQARARSLLDLLVAGRTSMRQGIPVELEREKLAIGERIVHLQALLSSESLSLPDDEAQRVERDLSRAEEEEKDLDAAIQRDQPGATARRQPRSLSLREIQELLDEHTALLEYFLGEDGSYLFVVTRQGLSAHSLPRRRDLAALVDRVSSAVSKYSRLRAQYLARDAYGLYRALISPAAAEIRGKSHLILAPDEFLHSLSFEVLLTGPVPDAGARTRDWPFLIRERSVSYVPSAGVMAQLLTERPRNEASPEPGKLFVGFGDPGETPARDRNAAIVSGVTGICASPGERQAGRRTARAADGAGPQALPGARDEVCRIARLFPADQAAVFTGPDATEENVKTSPLVASARNLHFAVHGFLDESHPDRSGLQLARGSSSVEDGLLRVREISNLDLHADLVVLSACQSGMGRVISGEGLIGMSRAFLYAGAGSIVVSLWKVDDEATSDLMVSFYSQLRAVGDKSEALRRAKLELIDQSRYSHPYFWAAFILVGRPR
jgi:CHAT domain-containing protein